jgi:DNA-binding transcriptional LysR family regulator
MTYDQLLTLDSIVKYGSFKAASEVMHKTQPSLSMAIKKLEEEFSIQLFDRGGYRPVLTHQGKEFYQRSQITLTEFKKLEIMAQEMGAGHESEINICLDAIFPICDISPTLESFFAPHISVSLNISADVLDGVINRIKSHEVDFAMGPDYELDEDIEKIKFSTVKMLPLISERLHHKVDGDIEALKLVPQIVVGSSVKEKNHIVHGGISNKYWYASDFSMKQQLIGTGLGWGRLAEHQVVDQISSGKLCIIENIPEVNTLDVGMFLLRSKSKVMGPNTKRLWEFLAKKSPAHKWPGP